MKVIHKNFKVGELKLQVSDMDDLWYLSHVIDSGDLVSGKTMRKVKVGSSENAKVVKKPVFLEIEVERVEFHKFSNSLRVSGVVRSGPEDVPRGSHHTLDVNEGTTIKIKKNRWLKFQIDRIEEACVQQGVGVLVCVIDRDTAGFALLKKYGYDYLGDVDGVVQKKDDEKRVESEFYPLVAKSLKDYVDRYSAEKVIVASPSFWKEDFMKVLKKKFPEVASSVVLATCNATGRSGVDEVLKRDEVKTVLAQDRAAKEMRFVEELLAEISKDNLAVYGFKETKAAVDAGAVKTLLVTDELIQDMRQKDKYAKLDEIMKSVEGANGSIHIISVDHDGGKKLKGLGGIGALLRYKLNY